jgi:hypothetical protein
MYLSLSFFFPAPPPPPTRAKLARGRQPLRTGLLRRPGPLGQAHTCSPQRALQKLPCARWQRTGSDHTTGMWAPMSVGGSSVGTRTQRFLDLSPLVPHIYVKKYYEHSTDFLVELCAFVVFEFYLTVVSYFTTCTPHFTPHLLA